MIETERLLLRSWKNEDLDAYARICADPVVIRYLMGGGGAPLAREQSEEQVGRFVRHWEGRGFGLWAVEEKGSGRFIGRLGLMRHDAWPGDDKTEVRWVLDRSCWGRGLATEGAWASLRYGSEELMLERVISIAWPRNAASRRVMEKLGPILRGEARWRGYDVVWYAIDRGDWQAG